MFSNNRNIIESLRAQIAAMQETIGVLKAEVEKLQAKKPYQSGKYSTKDDQMTDEEWNKLISHLDK